MSARATDAQRAVAPRFPPLVLAPRDQLQMRQPNARAPAANVVELVAGRYRAASAHPPHAMSELARLGPAVAVAIKST